MVVTCGARGGRLMSVRDAGRELIRSVAAPLRTIINGTRWPGEDGEFDVLKNGASTIIAHLAYCAITEEERAKRNRATVVPCRIYQELVSGERVDFIEAIGSMDFGDADVIQSGLFVAIMVPVSKFLFVGVRGTAFAYDWLVNLNATKANDGSGHFFHAGFLQEAQDLAAAIRERLNGRYARRIWQTITAYTLPGIPWAALSLRS
jgi:hypothetical protein